MYSAKTDGIPCVLFNANARSVSNDIAATRPSVGLGSNIKKSLVELTPGETPDPVFQSNSDDAGNGSLMRLAPIAACLWRDPEAAARAGAAIAGADKNTVRYTGTGNSVR